MPRFMSKCKEEKQKIKQVTDNKTNAKYLYDENQKTAYIELAEASGLTKIPNDKKDAVRSSTYGLGQLMKKVIEIHHPKKIVLGIGGSATTDMGAGMLEAMGVEFLDDKGFKLTKMNNSQLMKIRKMNLNYFSPCMAKNSARV